VVFATEFESAEPNPFIGTLHPPLVSRASKNLKNLRWFEVLETRGQIQGGKVSHYQVTIKVGFTLDDTIDPGA
jgi:predicted transcriptional regulator